MPAPPQRPQVPGAETLVRELEESPDRPLITWGPELLAIQFERPERDAPLLRLELYELKIRASLLSLLRLMKPEKKTAPAQSESAWVTEAEAICEVEPDLEQKPEPEAEAEAEAETDCPSTGHAGEATDRASEPGKPHVAAAVSDELSTSPATSHTVPQSLHKQSVAPPGPSAEWAPHHGPRAENVPTLRSIARTNEPEPRRGEPNPPSDYRPGY